MPTEDVWRFRFGAFEFDPAGLELRRAGRAVKVPPQSLKVLRMLVDRAGQLISRDEIQQALWGAETFVDFEQGVNHAIRDLRAALRDSADSPRYIETLPRRGYRFIAPVERVVEPIESAAAAPAHQSAGRWRGVVAIGVVVLTAGVIATWSTRGRNSEVRPNPASITVRPFTIVPADARLGVGLARAISARLGGQQHVPVRLDGAIPEGTNDRDDTPGALLLNGEVTRSGDDITAVAHLNDPASGEVVWSTALRLRAADLFSVEDVIADRVVQGLALRLAAAEQDRLRRRYTSNGAAYEQFLRGRAALAAYTREGTLDAIRAFERSLRLDPSYALARAGLAQACADMYLRFSSTSEVEGWGARAETEARTALELDPNLAEAHAARAAVARKREFDWSATMDSSRRALLLNPNLDQPHFFMAAAYYHLGYMQEALLEMQKGRALGGPDAIEPLRIEALVALFSGSFTTARVRLEEVSRASSQAIGDTYLALAYYYTGSVDRSRTMLEALASHESASTSTRAGAALAGLLADQKASAAARAAIARVLASEYRDHHVAYGLGVAYARLGDEDDAAKWLLTAADTGFPCLTWFERDPWLEGFRSRARFKDIVEHVRARRDAALP